MFKFKEQYRQFVSNSWKVGIIAVMLYIAFQVFADILAIKMTSLWGLTVSPAFFVFPLTFTFRDLVHKFIGKTGARLVIVTALGINVIMLLIFFIYIRLPAVAGTENIQAAIELIFGSMWRIVLASITAEFCSEMIDTEVYGAWVKRFAEKYQWGRVLTSNVVAGTVDIFVFKMVAFLGWLPMSVVWANVGSEMLLRLGLAIVSIPLIYIAPSPKDSPLKAFVRGLDEIQGH